MRRNEDSGGIKGIEGEGVKERSPVIHINRVEECWSRSM